MDCNHSDRGKEFNNRLLTKFAEYLGVRTTLNAAYSPHQDGVNEPGHSIVDHMMTRMRLQDPTMTAWTPLTWSLVAKNSLENVSGFSPFQIVYGINPKQPSVYTCGPPGLEEVSMPKSVVTHINAQHLARQAYVEGESSKSLKLALKQKIYRRPETIERNDWVFFQNLTFSKIWEEPVKILARDGKTLFAVRANKMLAINTEHAEMAPFDGEFLGKPVDKEKAVREVTEEVIKPNKRVSFANGRGNVVLNQNAQLSENGGLSQMSSQNVTSQNVVSSNAQPD